MSEGNISLLNCDFSQKKLRLTSPLSKMAVNLIGATMEDLRFISLDEYLRQNFQNQNLEKELQIERYSHYEENRKKLINEAKQMRENLIKEKEEESINKNKPNSTLYLSPKYNVNLSYNITNVKDMKKNFSADNFETNIQNQFTTIKLEKEKLHRLLEKEENNVKLQIDYECKIEENRRKNLEKMRNKELKEEKRRKEKERELAEKKEKEREKLLEKKKKEEEMLKEQEKQRKEEEKKEKKKLEEEKERKASEEKERKNKILERELKEEEFRKRINKMNIQQKERLLEKEKELNKKDLKRQKNLEELKKQNNKLITEKKLFLQERINKALNKSESKMSEKINEYFQKQKKIENIKKQKEQEKKNKLLQQSEEIIKRSEKMKKVLKQYDENHKLKIEKYNKKMEEINKRKEEKHKEKMIILEEERKKKEEKEKRLNEIRNKFEKNLEENRQKLMDKIIANDIKIKHQKIEQEKQMHIKYNKLYMSREDRKNKVIRNERVKDFQRTQKMDQIIARMKRLDNLQKDRSLLEEERKKIEDEIYVKKKIMLDRLHNIMRSNKSLEKEEIMEYVFDIKNTSKTPLNKGKLKIEE